MDEAAIDRDAGGVERLAIAGLARIDGRGRVRLRDKRDAPAAEAEDVLGDEETRAPVVDPDQVVVPAARIRRHRAVEEHHRDARFVERLRDPMIDVITGRRELERREEHT